MAFIDVKLLVFLLLLLQACGSGSSGGGRGQPDETLLRTAQLITLKPIKEINAEYTQAASGMVDLLEYYPLESPQGIIIGKIDEMIHYNRHIYIFDRLAGDIFVYTNKGAFVGNIGKKGKGPDEYADISAFSIDEDGNVCIWSPYNRKVFVYSVKGELKHSLDIGLLMMDDFYVNADSTIVGYEKRSANERLFEGTYPRQGRIFLLDGKGGLLDHGLTYRYSDALKTYPFSNEFYRFGDSLSLMEDFGNVVYRIHGRDMNPVPRYVFDFTGANVPLHYEQAEAVQRKLIDEYQKGGKDEWASLYRIYETDNYLGFKYGYDRYVYTSFYSKKSGNLINLGFFWINDRDNISMPSVSAAGPNDTFYGFIEAHALIRMVDRNETGASDRVEQLRAKLRETDNPVLVSFTLKDF